MKFLGKRKKFHLQVYEGLTVEFCKQVNANYILRGIRYVSDFEYEKAIADANRNLDPTIEYILSDLRAKIYFCLHQPL